jgi:D-tyrosyl-tRNA(Tyr) deacylase
MRVVLQRVTEAAVRVDDAVVGEIGPGLVALVGIGSGDLAADVDALAAKTAALRIFDTADGARCVADVAGAVLVISQFTLLADTRRGNRPSWTGAASPDHARPLVERFATNLEDRGIAVARGIFGAHMVVSLVNDGPVTIVLDREGAKSTK